MSIPADWLDIWLGLGVFLNRTEDAHTGMEIGLLHAQVHSI